MTTIKTRLIAWADIQDLQTMITALADFHGDTATLDHDRLNRDVFGANPWVTVIVAEQQNKLVGYVALCPLIQLQFGDRGYDLHHVYVTPDQRGTGVGRALITAAAAYAKAHDCRYIMVGTTPDNTAAQAAYVACGFDASVNTPNRFRMAL